MKNVIKYLILVFVVVSQLIACSDSKTDGGSSDSFDVQFELPTSINVTEGGEQIFTVINGKSPLTTDSFILESDSGISYVCTITQASSQSFTVRMAKECTTNSYRVFIKRDSRKKPYGKTNLTIVDNIITPDEGTTVYGVVSSADGPLKGVVVSDGELVTVTDEEGIYQLKSVKKWKYVFISVPSGYEVSSQGVLPQFSYLLKGAPSDVERFDFKLKKVNNQDTYKVFMLGDMHLANRTKDLEQFADFTTDLTNYMNQYKGTKMYAIALGDMTWDLYWYTNNYFFPQYLNTINAQLKDLQIFHTMGNHDNDYKRTSDFDAALDYVSYICPTYYSFNIGKVHYVVLDDIDCSPYDGTQSRNYVKAITDEQLEWLKKDLFYVDKSTPLVVATHAQIFNATQEDPGFEIGLEGDSPQNLFKILDGYKVHFVTGHTHRIFNVTPENAIVGGKDFYEHNSGAICASWWWSGNLTPGVHISVDGTPGGYGIWDVSGTDLKWMYKSTGWGEDYQFRSYDLNKVSFSLDDVPNIPSDATIRNAYNKYVRAYPVNSNNEVLINIWNWNANWTLNVVDEHGTNLNPTAVWAYDPLHIAALSVKRFNNSGIIAVPSFVTVNSTHFFKVKVKDADTDVKITVKDEFGHTWTENMQRPKAFSTDAYKN